MESPLCLVVESTFGAFRTDEDGRAVVLGSNIGTSQILPDFRD